MTDADFADNQAHLTNTLVQAKCLPHSLEQTASGIGLKQSSCVSNKKEPSLYYEPSL